MWAVPFKIYSVSGNIISFSDISNIYEIYCTPGTIDESQELLEENRNNYYEISISGFIPKDSDEVRSAILDMIRKLYVIIYENGNGDFKLARIPDYLLRLKSNLSSDKTESDLAGHSIIFSGKTLIPAVFIDNPF